MWRRLKVSEISSARMLNYPFELFVDANENIHCNCVVPSLIYTPLVENFANSVDPDDQETAREVLYHNVIQLFGCAVAQADVSLAMN